MVEPPHNRTDPVWTPRIARRVNYDGCSRFCLISIMIKTKSHGDSSIADRF